MIKKQIASLLFALFGAAALNIFIFYLLSYTNLNIWEYQYIIFPVFAIAIYWGLCKLQKKVSIWFVLPAFLIGAVGSLYAYFYLRFDTLVYPVYLMTMIVAVIVPFLIFLGINRTRPKFRSCFIIFLGALLINFAVAPLRGGYIAICGISGLYLSTLVGFWLLFIYCYWMFYKYREELSVGLIFLSLFIGISILTSPLHILDFEGTKGSFYQTLIHLLALILGFACYKANKKLKIVLIPCTLLIGSWMAVEGYKLYHNKLYYETFTSEVYDPKQYALNFQSAEGDTLSLADFQGKYLLIDHWYTYCGYCYEAFPQVQALYDKYRNSEEVQIITIHSRMKDSGADGKSETTSTGKEILEREGYTLPVYSISIEDQVLKDLGVKAYPTVLIFDKDSYLVFRGDLEFAQKFLEKRVEN